MSAAKEGAESINIIGQNEEKALPLKRFHWRGKRVTEAVYRRKLQQQEKGKNLRNIYGSKKIRQVQAKAQSNKKINPTVVHSVVEGRRIVGIKTLGQQLFCKDCKSILSLLDISEERQHGLASTFYITCRKCCSITAVYTDTQHVLPSKKNHFDVNTKAVIGVLNSGIGNTQFNKVLAALNMSPLTWTCYKTHEDEVGRCVEDMAVDSCREAALEERGLTIENIDKLKLLL